MGIAVSRATHRAELRGQLRDPSTKIWTDVDLNRCLNEALVEAQQLVGNVSLLAIAGNGTRHYDLAAGVASVDRVLFRRGSGTLTANPYTEIDGWALIRGVDTSGAVTALAESAILDVGRVVSVGESLLVYRTLAPAPFGDPTVIGSGVDVATVDLAPGDPDDTQEARYLYACARLAAYRFAKNLRSLTGGRDYEDEYKAALQERREILDLLSGPSGSLSFDNGLFS